MHLTRSALQGTVRVAALGQLLLRKRRRFLCRLWKRVNNHPYISILRKTC